VRGMSRHWADIAITVRVEVRIRLVVWSVLTIFILMFWVELRSAKRCRCRGVWVKVRPQWRGGLTDDGPVGSDRQLQPKGIGFWGFVEVEQTLEVDQGRRLASLDLSF
jgi:hypothetical protein